MFQEGSPGWFNYHNQPCDSYGCGVPFNVMEKDKLKIMSIICVPESAEFVHDLLFEEDHVLVDNSTGYLPHQTNLRHYCTHTAANFISLSLAFSLHTSCSHFCMKAFDSTNEDTPKWMALCRIETRMYVCRHCSSEMCSYHRRSSLTARIDSTKFIQMRCYC